MYRISVILALFLMAGNAGAYVGPGLGVGVIGAVVGIILAVFFAIVGLFWYPIKRALKKKGKPESVDDE